MILVAINLTNTILEAKTAEAYLGTEVKVVVVTVTVPAYFSES